MGIEEISVILILALIIWGPRKIVEMAGTLGKMVRALRKVTFDFTTTLTKELSTEEKDGPPQSKINHDGKSRESLDASKTEDH